MSNKIATWETRYAIMIFHIKGVIHRESPIAVWKERHHNNLREKGFFPGRVVVML